MESVGAFPEGEWDCFSRTFTTEEEEIMGQLINQCPLPEDQMEGLNFEIPSYFWATHEANNVDMAMADPFSSNFQYSSQDSSYSSGCSSDMFLSNSSHINYYLSETNHISPDFTMTDEKNADLAVPMMSQDTMEVNEEPTEAIDAPTKEIQLKRKSEISSGKTETDPIKNPEKRTRVSRDVQKGKKNVQSRRKQKQILNENNEEETNAGPQSSSSLSSEDDSNASQETNGEDSKGSDAALALNGKTRASRGSATDPQSLYARKRRERINERLRTLQGLVPNGTKVDISTMLEEAVQYVKFLQLQIKLLSSDDMWMYAPIAYNGMDIGLDWKISPPL